MNYRVYTENGVICVFLEDHGIILHLSTDEYRAFCQDISYHGMRIEAERKAEKRGRK